MAARLLVLWGTPQDPTEFDRHYQDVHVPLACKMPGLRRYTVGRDVVGADGEAHYLVAELDFDDAAAMRAAVESPEGRAAAADGAALRAMSTVRSLTFEVEIVF